MTDSNSWPDPSRPGVPLNPERDGWHWLIYPDGELRHRLWDATGGQGWAFGPPHGAPETCRYISPVMTPQEVSAAVQAEREAADRLAVAAEAMPRATPGPGDSGTLHSFQIEAGVVWELDRAIKLFRARGPSDALAAALAQAEKRGMERAMRALRIMRDCDRECDAESVCVCIRAAMGGDHGV